MNIARPIPRTHAVLLACLTTGEKYGLELREAYEKSGVAMPVGSLYTTLYRMVQAGLVKARYGDPGPLGGKCRRYFRITPNGIAALKGFRKGIEG